MDSIRHRIETGELSTLLAVVHEYCQLRLKSSPVYDEQFENGVFQYALHCAGSRRVTGQHEHKKQAKLLAAREFLRLEDADLLELFETRSNGRKPPSPPGSSRTTPRIDSGFGKIAKARSGSSAATACHPYSRPGTATTTAAAPDPLLDPHRKTVAVHRVLAEIDRGEVITPYDALDSLQDGLCLPKASVSCSQLGNRMFNVTIADGNRVYGEAQHLLKPHAKRLAFDDAVRYISTEIWNRLLWTELQSYRCSGTTFLSYEDVLHEFVSRNFRTSVSFQTGGSSERNEVVMQARVHGVIVGTGCHANIQLAQSAAIEAAIADLCPYLVDLVQPRDPRLFLPLETFQYTPASPKPFYAVPPSERNGTPPAVSPVPLSHLPAPPIPEHCLASPSFTREKLMKPRDFGLPPAVVNLIERIDQGSITTVSALFAAYLQLVDRTTATFDMRSQEDGSFRCDIVINGKSRGHGEHVIKKQAKTAAIRNVMRSFCPVLMDRFTERNPTLPE